MSASSHGSSLGSDNGKLNTAEIEDDIFREDDDNDDDIEDEERPSFRSLQGEDVRRPSVTVYQLEDQDHPDVKSIQNLVSNLNFSPS